MDMFLRHGPSDDICGQQLRASIQLAKAELGLPGNLFQYDFKQLGHLVTNCWIKKAWEEFQHNELQVKEATKSLIISRTGDKYIMEEFIKKGFKLTKLKRLNEVRIRLGIYLLSDIVSGNGRFILHEALNDTDHLQNHFMKEIYQGELPEKSWKLWRHALKKSFPQDNKRRLLNPIGKWHETNHTHPAYFDIQRKITYIRDKGKWIRYQHEQRNLNTKTRYLPITSSYHLPQKAEKAKAWINKGRLIFHGYAKTLHKTTVIPNSIVQAIHQLPEEWKWTIDQFYINTKEETLIRTIKNGQAIAVADGSLKNKKGTAAFCITDKEGNIGIYGNNKTPGNEDDQCSYRSEVGGIIGIMMLIDIIQRIYGLDKTIQIQIGCDNKEAGKHVLEFTRPINPLHNHFDILRAARNIRQTSRIQYKYRWVEGHQREKYGSHHDVWSLLNDKMDIMAKAHWHQTQDERRSTVCMPNEWIITRKGIKITTNFKYRWRMIFQQEILENKWLSPSKRKQQVKPPLFTKREIDIIAHEVIEKTWKKLDGNRQRFISKLMTETLPSGTIMKRNGFWNHDRCPLCNNAEEDNLHLFQCHNTNAEKFRQTKIEELREFLSQINTAPQIVNTILVLLEFELLGKSIDADQLRRDRMWTTTQQQLSIGTYSIIQGRLVKDWHQLQHYLFQQYQPWRTGETWMQQVLIKLWDTMFSIWEYRNKILHDRKIPHAIDEDELQLNIIEAWSTRGRNMSQHNQNQYKGITCEELLEKSVSYQLQWLHNTASIMNPIEEATTNDDVSNIP